MLTCLWMQLKEKKSSWLVLPPSADSLILSGSMMETQASKKVRDFWYGLAEDEAL